MTVERECKGHTNGFRHLEEKYGGLEEIFDLGIKYDSPEDPEGGTVIRPGSGSVTGAEPFLPMYISVARFDGTGRIGTLHYGLTRSKWNNCIESTTQDQEKLLVNARPFIIKDLKSLQEGQRPKSLTEPTMV